MTIIHYNQVKSSPKRLCIGDPIPFNFVSVLLSGVHRVFKLLLSAVCYHILRREYTLQCIIMNVNSDYLVSIARE